MLNPLLTRRALAVLAAAPLLPAQARQSASWATRDGQAPLVLAHRGASGYLPEHTLAAYELGVRMGADYIEPDLQLTRDGYLIALHDPTLERTTDAATRFAPRNGGWRAADFTLEEIRTLAMRPQGTARLQVPGFRPSAAHPLRVPTLEEVIVLARRLQAEGAPQVGLYVEAKQPGPRMAQHILDTLAGYGLRGSDKVFLQSFDADTIRNLQRRQSAMALDFKLVQLSGAPNRLLATGLDRIAAEAHGVGVSIRGDGMSRSFVELAHRAGLVVHGYTFNEAQPALAVPELRKFLNWGLDGVFANYPDLALQARAQMARADSAARR